MALFATLQCLLTGKRLRVLGALGFVGMLLFKAGI
jgi:hypothetical protein